MPATREEIQRACSAAGFPRLVEYFLNRQASMDEVRQTLGQAPRPQLRSVAAKPPAHLAKLRQKQRAGR